MSSKLHSLLAGLNRDTLQRASIRGATFGMAALLGLSEIGCSREEPSQNVNQQARDVLQRIGDSFSQEDRGTGIALHELEAKFKNLREVQAAFLALKLELSELNRTVYLESTFVTIATNKTTKVSRAMLAAAQALARVTFSEVPSQQEQLSRRLITCAENIKMGRLTPDDLSQIKLQLMPFEIAIGSDIGLIKPGVEVARAIEYGTRWQVLARRIERFASLSGDRNTWSDRKQELLVALDNEQKLLTMSSEPVSFATIHSRVAKTVALLGKMQTLISDLTVETLSKIEATTIDEDNLPKNAQLLRLHARSLQSWAENHSELPFWLPDRKHKGRPYYVDEDSPYYQRARLLINNPPRPPSPPDDD